MYVIIALVAVVIIGGGACVLLIKKYGKSQAQPAQTVSTVDAHVTAIPMSGMEMQPPAASEPQAAGKHSIAI